jgi:hypothetical protein
MKAPLIALLALLPTTALAGPQAVADFDQPPAEASGLIAGMCLRYYQLEVQTAEPNRVVCSTGDRLAFVFETTFTIFPTATGSTMMARERMFHPSGRYGPPEARDDEKTVKGLRRMMENAGGRPQ